MVIDTRTGRTRHAVRTRWFREPMMVLQVEVRSKGYECDPQGGGRDVDYTYWRDARLEDLTVQEG